MRAALAVSVVFAALAGFMSAGAGRDRIGISAFRFAPATFGVAPDQAAATTIQFRLSAPATVTIAFDRELSGIRVGGRCVAPGRRHDAHHECWISAVVGRIVRRVSHSGEVALAFAGRFGSRALRPGAYRATIAAAGAAGFAMAWLTVVANSPNVFPGPSDTGTPPGWKPARVVSSDLHVARAGAVVQNVLLANGANLYIDAPDVTVRDVDIEGGSIRNCDNWFGGHAPCEPGLLVEDTTIELEPGHTWADYDNTVQATLASTLSANVQISDLPVRTVANPVSAGTPLLIVLGASVQMFTAAAGVSPGATDIPVVPAAPSYPIPAGTPLTTTFCQPAIWLGDYRAERVKVWRRCAAFYSGDQSGGAGGAEVDDSYVNLNDGPFNSGDDPYHSEALQCYDSAGVTLSDDTFDTTDASHGTSSFFCPSGQGNTAATVDGLLVMNGSNQRGVRAADGTSNYDCCGYAFRDGVPGSVSNLNIVGHSWSYGPIQVQCDLLRRWSARIVAIDRQDGGTSTAPYVITRVIRRQPCDTSVGN